MDYVFCVIDDRLVELPSCHISAQPLELIQKGLKPLVSGSSQRERTLLQQQCVVECNDMFRSHQKVGIEVLQGHDKDGQK